jgi:hypothetical protein
MNKIFPFDFKLQRYLLLLFIFAVVALLYTWPIFKHLHNWGIQDWDQHLFYHGVPRKTVLEYGQLPLWNPWYVGGTVMLANPQSRLLSPFFLLHLLLGEVIAIKLEIWLHIIIGLAGGYALGRFYRLNTLAALLTAAVFMLNSMHALSLTVGMTWFLAVAYVPWAFLFYLKSWENLPYGVPAGLVLALIFFEGGAYPLAILLLFLGLYGFFAVVFKEARLTTWLKVMAVAVIFMLGFGAVKFLPSMEFQRNNPRLVYDYSGYSLNALRFSWFQRDQRLDDIAQLPIEQPGFIDGVCRGMDENGMYIRLIPFGVAIIGLGLHDKKRFILCCSVF